MFKEGRKLCDGMSPTVQAPYSKSLNGNVQVSPYSPHLAPDDFHLFLHYNKFLAGQSPRSDQATKNIAHDILKGYVASIFDEGTHKLVS